MAQQTLGIMRSGQTLSIAGVTRSYKQATLKFCNSYTLLSDLDNQDALQRELISIIQTLTRDEKLSKAHVAFGLSSKDSMLSILEMPPVSKEDIRQILEFELDAHLPVDPDTITFDAQILDATAGMNNRVILAATDKQNLKNYQTISGKAGVSLDSISPAVMTVTNLATKIWKPVTEAKFNVFICAQNGQYEVVVTSKGQYQASRSVDFENPWNSLGPDENETDTQRSDIPAAILRTIQLTLLMCNRSSALNSIEEITCLGDVDDHVLKEIKERMPTTVFSSLMIEKLVDQKRSFNEIAAIFLATDLLEEDEFINVIPPDLRPVRRDVGRILIGAAAGVLAAAMILVGANNYWKTDLKYLATEARIASLETSVNQITEINQKFISSQDHRKFFMSKSSDYPSHLDILKEVTILLPAEDTETTKKVWLESYEVEDNELMIRGDSDSPEGLLTSLEESPFFEKVKFDGTVSGTRFTIKASISKLSDEEEQSETEGGSEEESAETETTKTRDKKATPTPEEKEAGDKEDASESDQAEGDSDQDEPEIRGPAFPRTRAEEPEMSEGDDMQHVDPLSPEEQEKLDKEKQAEDMDAMKENLFNFIQERKSEGDLEGRDNREYQEQDPDEAAANFLEFLKAAADSEGEK